MMFRRLGRGVCGFCGVIALAFISLSVTSMANVANAQPGQVPPAAGPQAPYAQGVRPLIITPKEAAMLSRGEYSDGQIIGSGLVGTFFGLGLGQAVQGRWSEKGWIFTVGEPASMIVLMAGVMSCIGNSDYYADGYSDRYSGGSDSCNDGLIIGSLVALVGLRIWEIIDVWTAPSQHNKRLRQLRARLGIVAPPRWGVYAAPTNRGGGGGGGVGGVGGISLRF